MKLVTLYIIFHLFFLNDCYPQVKIKVTGKVKSCVNNEGLIGATLFNERNRKGTTAGIDGNYSLILNPGKQHLKISFIGYQTIDTIFIVNKPSKIDFCLKPRIIEGEEINIIANKNKSIINSGSVSEINLKAKDIKKLPSIMGEHDPLKTLQLTPGVQSTTEGGTGFFVRGGGADQNLVIFDNAEIYNPGHLLGFFSVFNPDVIQEVTFMKSGIPAQYGGRLSSVVKITSSKGEKAKPVLQGNIGLISSRLALSSPIGDKNGSLILGIRKTYLDLLVKPAINSFLSGSSPIIMNSKYNFYDINLGGTFKIGDKNYFSFSGYYGNDHFSLDNENTTLKNNLDWGNYLISANWSHVFSDHFNWNTSFALSEYNFELSGIQGSYFFQLNSKVNNKKINSYLGINMAHHHFKTGVELKKLYYLPNQIDAEAGDFILNFSEFNPLHAYEMGVFVNDDYQLSPKIKMVLGLRYTTFAHVGPYTEIQKDEDNTFTDTISFPRNKILSNYQALEPRLSFNFMKNQNTAYKFSFMRLSQYSHLATSSSVSLPTDIWLPSFAKIKPQYGYQTSVGYFREFGNMNDYEFSSEIYYKKLNNQLEFLNGVLNNSLRMRMFENIVTGHARSYGLEIFLKKKSGKTNGWLSYTLSRVERRFDEIKANMWYPAKHDRRHDFSSTLIHQYNDKWSFSLVFVYATGNAYTIPVARYIIQGNLINEYGDINGFRMPAYHRMDVSATLDLPARKERDSELVLSIYNLYNRQNPFYFYFETVLTEEHQLEVKLNEVTLFPILPSVSWRFKF